MKFFGNPFVFITPVLIVGLLLGELLNISLHWSVYLLAFVPIVLISYIERIRFLFLPVSLLFIVVSGAMIMQFVRNSGFGVTAGEKSRIAVVSESETVDRNWKKAIVTIQREKHYGIWKDADEKVLVYSQDQLHEGDVLLLRNDLEPIRNQGNPGEFDAQAYWNGKNIRWMGFVGAEDYQLLDRNPSNGMAQFFEGIRLHLSSSIDAHLDGDEAALAKALILGDKRMLSAETRDAFGNAGAMHVLAISGLHVGIIMYLLFFLFQQFPRWISRRNAVVASLIFIWLFAAVTGGSPSVLRSALMFSVLLVGQQWGRGSNNLNTLFFSAFVLLLINPLLLFDIGFQLSYGAMLGIFLFFERVQSLLRIRNKWLQKAWDGTALGIAAQVFTIPLVLHYFHQFPNYFWLTNLGVMLLAGVILALGLFFFAVHAIPGLNVLLATLLGWSVFALLSFINWIDSLPGGVAYGFDPNFVEIVLFYLAAIVLIFRYNQNRRWVPIAAGGLLIALFVGWQWHRVETVHQNELVVFNSSRPVFAVKHGDEIVGCCLKGDEEKAMRLLVPYQKIRSGNIRLVQIDATETKIQMEGRSFVIRDEENGISLRSGTQKWFLRTRYREYNETNVEVIDMPYLEPHPKHRNLSGGASLYVL